MKPTRSKPYSFIWHDVLCCELLPVYALRRFYTAAQLLQGTLPHWSGDLHWNDPLFALLVLLGAQAATLLLLGLWALRAQHRLARFDPAGLDLLRMLCLLSTACGCCLWLCEARLRLPDSGWTLQRTLEVLAPLSFLPVLRATRGYYDERRLYLRGPLAAQERRAPLLHHALTTAGLMAALSSPLLYACIRLRSLQMVASPALLAQMPTLLPSTHAGLLVCLLEIAVLLCGFCRLDRMEKAGLRLLLAALWGGAAGMLGALLLFLSIGDLPLSAQLAFILDANGPSLLFLPLGVTAALAGYYGLWRRGALR